MFLYDLECCAIKELTGLNYIEEGRNYDYTNIQSALDDMRAVETSMAIAITDDREPPWGQRAARKRLAKAGFKPMISFTAARTGNPLTIWFRLLVPEEELRAEPAPKPRTPRNPTLTKHGVGR